MGCGSLSDGGTGGWALMRTRRCGILFCRGGAEFARCVCFKMKNGVYFKCERDLCCPLLAVIYIYMCLFVCVSVCLCVCL